MTINSASIQRIVGVKENMANRYMALIRRSRLSPEMFISLTDEELFNIANYGAKAHEITVALRNEAGTYPEHAKIARHRDEHEAIVSFVSFLDDSDTHSICHWSRSEWKALGETGLAKLIAVYFDIDYNKFLDEKDVMLAEIRKAHDDHT